MYSNSNFVEIMKKRLQENPDSRLFITLAEEYRKRDDYEMAIDTVNEGLKRHPQYTYGRRLLIDLYLENNMNTEALSECKKILTHDPYNIFANKTCARLAVASGDRDAAYEYYSRVLEFRPNDKEAIDFLLGYKKEHLQKPVEIEQEESPKPQEDPHPLIQEHLKQAEFLISKARYKEAVSLLNLVLSISPHAMDVIQKREELKNLYEMHLAKIQRTTKRLKDLKGIFVRAHFKAS